MGNDDEFVLLNDSAAIHREASERRYIHVMYVIIAEQHGAVEIVEDGNQKFSTSSTSRGLIWCIENHLAHTLFSLHDKL